MLAVHPSLPPPPSSPAARRPPCRLRPPLAPISGETTPTLSAVVSDGRDGERVAYAVALRDAAAGRSRSWSSARGRAIHARIKRTNLTPDAFLYDCLLHLYSKSGELWYMRKVFDEMPERDSASWSTVISAYVEDGNAEEGVKVFLDMKWEGFLANRFVLSSALDACSECQQLELLEQLHGEVIKRGIAGDAYVASCLVEGYGACGEAAAAESVFARSSAPDSFSLNAMLSVYLRAGEHGKLMAAFRSGTTPCKYTFPAALKCCGELRSAALGRAVHGLLVKHGTETDGVVNGSLIGAYAECRCPEDAERVFRRIANPNVLDCSAMLACYGRNGMAAEAVELYVAMAGMGLRRNEYICVGVASAAADAGDLQLCRALHGHILKNAEFAAEREAEVSRAVMSMYIGAGSAGDARKVFDGVSGRDTVLWNTMLSAYHSGEDCAAGPELFSAMVAEGAAAANKYTYVSVLRSCASLRDCRLGMQVHARILKCGGADPQIGRVLLDMYAACGTAEDAGRVFDRLPEEERDAFAWTSAVSAYAKADHGEKAIELFRKMLRHGGGVGPNASTVASCLSACSDLAAFASGLQLHAWVIKSGWSSPFVSSALVGMYAKCGCLADAEAAFFAEEERDEALWNTMICSYAHHGRAADALAAFRAMLAVGGTPDKITFVGVLSACSHAGRLDEGTELFSSLRDVYGVAPTAEHYGCMVDILAKAGKLSEAEAFARGIPEATPAPAKRNAWKAILAACRTHRDVAVAERAAAELFELGPHDEAAYVLLAGIYADAGRRDEARAVREKLRLHGLKKEPGCSWIEIAGGVHVFLAEDLDACPSPTRPSASKQHLRR